MKNKLFDFYGLDPYNKMKGWDFHAPCPFGRLPRRLDEKTFTPKEIEWIGIEASLQIQGCSKVGNLLSIDQKLVSAYKNKVKN